jgi:hypothetical protein
MASLEDLPADQRAVLQMVLQRGRTYDDIAGLLSIDRSAVRQRALDAFDALTPDGVDAGPEHALVTDYLLSQLSDQVAEQVYIYLGTADDERSWAHAIAERLRPLASKPLPEVPVAAQLRSDEPIGGYKPYVPDEEPEPSTPVTASSRPTTPQAPRAAESAAAGHSRLPRPAGPRRPRVLVPGLSLAALILAVVVVVLLANSSSSPPQPKRAPASTQPRGETSTQTNTGTTGTSTTKSGTQILAAMNLTSPVGATKTLGVAQVVRDDGVVEILVDAQGVPANSAHNAYGVWLYNSASSYRFLGFDPNLVGKNEKLVIAPSRLPADASDYKRLLITLETQQKPKTPGEVVLSGPFREK